MSQRWTDKDVKALLAAGKIKGYKLVTKDHQAPAGKRVGKHFKKAHPQKDWIAQQLLAWCQESGEMLHEEYNVDPTRRWRADWAIPGLKIMVEYEGLAFKKTGHTSSEGYTGNTDKYNSAQALGWKVLRFTFLNYETLIDVLNKNVKL